MAKEQSNNSIKMKVYHTLKEDEIRGLKIITQTEFNAIVDALYAKPLPDYKNIPSIIRLPSIKETLSKALGVQNSNFFLKSGLGHVRPDRKSGLGQGQDLRIEEMKGLLGFMTTVDTAFIDMREKHQNFMLVGIDESNYSRINRIIFNKDKLGNYIVTIGKVKTEDMNDINYKRVGAGVAPAIWRGYCSNLPPLTTLVLSPTPSGAPDKGSIPQMSKMSMGIDKNNGKITAENFQAKLQYMCSLNKKETIFVIAHYIINMMTQEEKQKLDKTLQKEFSKMPPSIDKVKQFTNLMKNVATGKVTLNNKRHNKEKMKNNNKRGDNYYDR